MIKKLILDYLKENGIKQTWLSEKTGITRHALCTALNGSRNMDVEEYAKICDALGLDYEYFFNKRAQMKSA
jgi:Plasmid maintenance system antidote protein